MRLIDADALIERIESDIKAIEDKEPQMAMGAIGVLNTIKKTPTEKLQLSPKTSTNGTYIRDGRLINDLVYRGEAEVPDTDLISRQAAIDYLVTNMRWYDEDGDPIDDSDEKRAIITDLLDGVPPVEPPKKVIAQIKVDTDEIVERIKEEYEIKDRPACEDAISKGKLMADLQEKTGEWAVDEHHIEEIYVPPVICSKCGKRTVSEWGDETEYCPRCGSRNYVDERGDKE